MAAASFLIGVGRELGRKKTGGKYASSDPGVLETPERIAGNSCRDSRGLLIKNVMGGINGSARYESLIESVTLVIHTSEKSLGIASFTIAVLAGWEKVPLKRHNFFLFCVRKVGQLIHARG